MERKQYDMRPGWVDRRIKESESIPTNEKETEFEDTNIVAYLHYKGFRFAPVKSPKSDRVSFIVYGEIGNSMDEMYQNGAVKVLDFIKCLKIVRSAIFSIKKM